MYPTRRHLRTVVVLVLLTCTWIWCEPAVADVEAELVVENLLNPCGLAIQPETGHLFVADSGNLRVVRVVDGSPRAVIAGFPQDRFGDDPGLIFGPLALGFLDRQTLVVGGGGSAEGQDLVRIYSVPATAAASAIPAHEMQASFALPADGQMPAEGDFFGIAIQQSAVFFSCQGDDEQGWLARAAREGNTLRSLERFIPTRYAQEAGTPTGLAISSEGHLVAGQLGRLDAAPDSRISFYNPNDGRLLLNLQTGLRDITGVAYSPAGQLYATDLAWAEPAEGGLFQLIATTRGGKLAVEAKKIIALERPTALIFGSGGSLYVSVLGNEAREESGKVLRIRLGEDD